MKTTTNSPMMCLVCGKPNYHRGQCSSCEESLGVKVKFEARARTGGKVYHVYRRLQPWILEGTILYTHGSYIPTHTLGFVFPGVSSLLEAVKVLTDPDLQQMWSEQQVAEGR
jgi:hypothetical protein